MSKERSEVYLTDSYLRELDASVIEVTEEGVILDWTIFYPQGGGQPDDKGVLVYKGSEIPVTGLKKTGDNVLLHIDEKLQIGDTVTQKIDWDYRYKLMKHHTTLHVLSAIVWNKFQAKVTGGTIYHNKARLDFDLQEFNAELAQSLVDELNETLAQNHEVEIKFVSREEAESNPDLIRTKINLLPDFIKEIRLVKIGNVDIQADGGLHVKSTSEIGDVRLEKTENKGKGRKRVSVAIVE